jgi:protein-tyrosine phosphatase
MKVLMVCLGNICRSPIAEGILREKSKAANLTMSTDSAGTSAYHVGEAPDHRMILAAKKNGYDISDLRARQFIVADFDEFDLIYVMDKSNQTNVLNLARNENDASKVKMILNEVNENADNEVPDPYFGGDQGFQQVIDLLSEAIDVIIAKYS